MGIKRDNMHFSGCLLGGAVGDALGYSIEFMSMEEIKRVYGNQGLRELILDESYGKALV